MAIRWTTQSARNGMIQLALQSLGISIYFFAFRPVRRLVGRQASANGIDSKSKKLIKCGVKGLQAKRSLRQQIPVESFNVPNIKNDAMALGNRPIIQRVFPYDTEHVVRSFARAYQAGV
jgi:hypothetical protein